MQDTPKNQEPSSKDKHPTLQEVLEAVESNTFGLTNYGFCLACGAQADSVEPDAAGYQCDECGKNEVYGAEELLLMMV
jgi:predicted RNA-binding Zn-ribbon protein involved in translation (DUF1610 family)